MIIKQLNAQRSVIGVIAKQIIVRPLKYVKWLSAVTPGFPRVMSNKKGRRPAC